MIHLVTILVVIALVQSTALGAVLTIGKRRALTERVQRAKEEEFRRKIDRAPVMMWTARPDTTIDYVNHTCVELTGLPAEKLLGEGWLNIVHPDDLERCIATYVPAMLAREPAVVEYRLRRADGAYRNGLDAGVPYYAPDGSFAGYVGALVDITERKDAEEQSRESKLALEASHREIQQLAGQLIGAYEDERRRLARELHDDLTQRLARLAIDVGCLENSPGSHGGLRSLRTDLIRLSEDVHALSYRLHPSVLDDLGLVEALRTECDRVRRQNALRVNVDTQGVPAGVPVEVSLCLFRVAQEALNNAARHAGASAVSVLLAPSRAGLRLAISDDGNGFDPGRPRARASLGLASMRERVRIARGELDIESKPGRGTTVVAWVPA